MLAVAGWLTSRSMFVRSLTAKPGAETVSVYRPGVICANWYCPLESVSFSRTAPVPSEVNLTEALGIAAPLRSVTRPLSDVVACANATTDAQAKHNTKNKETAADLKRITGDSEK